MRLPLTDDSEREIIRDPVGTARCLIEQSDIPVETRPAEHVMAELLDVAGLLRTRWELLTKYRVWEKSGRVGVEPVFWDEDRSCERSARFALAPCQLVNNTLSHAIGMILRRVTPTQRKDLQALPDWKELTLLKNVGIHGEEAMEQEALRLVFQIAADYADQFLDLVRNTTLNRYQQQTPSALLEALVVDLPRSLKFRHPDIYTDLPFPYLRNYSSLVKAELQLLTVPAILQNRAAAYHHSSLADLLNSSPILREALMLAPTCPEVKHFISAFPELFGYRDLAEKTVTFVGAGFPLTGIVLHILTGANINLVDYSVTAVESAKKFLSLTERLGITGQGAIKVILADALDVVYLPTSKLPGSIKRHDGRTCPDTCPMNPKMGSKMIVPTDILDIASAICPETTGRLVEENGCLVPAIRKRNVRGVSEVIYERFNLKEGGHFRVVGEVTPPQNVLSGATPVHLITDLTAPHNVNSCQLFLNTDNFGSKWKYLESILDQPGMCQLRKAVGDIAKWDKRVKEFYSIDKPAKSW